MFSKFLISRTKRLLKMSVKYVSDFKNNIKNSQESFTTLILLNAFQIYLLLPTYYTSTAVLANERVIIIYNT